MPINTILLLIAMEKEAKPIIDKMQMKSVPKLFDKDLPAKVYQLSTQKGEIVLVVSGKCPSHKVDRIGSQGLNLVAWEAIKTYTPDIVINAGTGGGFMKQGSAPGDVYLSESIKYHDRLFYPDTYFLNYGIGTYKSINAPVIAKKLGLKKGVISTGASMIASVPEERQMKANNAAVKEMEAAGIAEVCQLKQVSFLAIKIITDLVDTDECPQNQFTNNFGKLINHLADKVHALCSLLIGEELSNIHHEDLVTESSIPLYSKL